ncbi:uncharacterized protein UTRI_00635 [Ustilago trichophora]|uniref:Carboxylic ester hydrolase n=1 Tax=Ustilago trichophora TaxID=86804 RepID=A0A5C3DS59_9BASI|nr:uncharacterized protein UTRI_00635 [Ustilago trichophora]
MRTPGNLRAAFIAAALAIAVIQASGTIVKRATSEPTVEFDDVKSCKDLPGVLQKLLAAGWTPDGKPVHAKDIYSFYYQAGSNPNAEGLYKDIPSTAFGPTDDKDGAIKGSNGFDKDGVLADNGYGEEAHASYSRDGGLPAFCRVGGMIDTDDTGSNRAHFEVWMPLADTPDPNDCRPSDKKPEAVPEAVPAAAAGEPQGDIRDAALAAKAAYKRACNSGWTKRLVFVVGGGLRGAAAFPEMKQTMARYRTAVASTNGGHFSAQDGTKWMPGQTEKWIDYGHRAVHLSTIASQLAVSTFYAARPKPKGDAKTWAAQTQGAEEPIFYSYFKGCSTGGRAAMAEAQRYPLDFDGILAGSPGFEYNKLKAYQVHINSFLADNKTEGWISPAAYPLINKAVLQTCDNEDGVVDNIVSLPRQCKPDFAKLIGCTSLGITPEKVATTDSAEKPAPAVGSPSGVGTKSATPLLPRDVTPEPAPAGSDVKPAVIPEKPDGKDTDGKDKDAKKEEAPKCLTDAQLETLKNLYTDYKIDGKLIREAILPGSEFGWKVTNAVMGKYGSSPSGWYHYQVMGDTVWDDKSFDAGKALTPALIEEGEKKDPGGTNTFNPDLNGFFDAGGKLMHYHGLADALVPPLVSPRYYELVKSKVGAKIKDSYKLYMIPGMLHCRGGAGCFNFGGAGQYEPGSRPLSYDSKHDMLLALMEWVERGQVPNTLIGAAYKTKAGGAPEAFSDDTPFGNGLRLTRPLCPYPTEARLRSNARSADTSDANAFECA